ncbi:hypothetical protein LSAT2_031431 [Lamellibrachia satsuma]|nr:hypothetical protein LSAT2_031431 [Lamellibrachia satsuma]
MFATVPHSCPVEMTSRRYPRQNWKQLRRSSPHCIKADGRQQHVVPISGTDGKLQITPLVSNTADMRT